MVSPLYRIFLKVNVGIPSDVIYFTEFGCKCKGSVSKNARVHVGTWTACSN